MARPNLDNMESSDIAQFEKDVFSQFGEDDAGDESSKTPTADDLEGDEGDTADTEDEGTEESEDTESKDDSEDAEEREDELLVKVRSDKRGNLVDPRTGKIVAAAGPARRFYEDLTNARKQIGSLQSEVTRRDALMSQARDAIITLNAKIEASNKIHDLPKQLGLTPQDQAEFMALAAQFKDNNKALDAIRYLLTKAAQRGIDIKSLGAGSNAIDPSIITNELSQKIEAALKPLNDRFTQNDQREQELNAIRQEISQFTQQNPDSQQYLPVLGKILENPQFSQLGLNGAWLMLQNYLLRKNMRQQSRRPAGGQSGQNRPNGRARPGFSSSSGDNPNAIDNSPVSVEQSFRDIVKGVIADYGEPE